MNVFVQEATKSTDLVGLEGYDLKGVYADEHIMASMRQSR